MGSRESNFVLSRVLGGLPLAIFANSATLDMPIWQMTLGYNLQLCQALLGPALHQESGPIFNPNPAFLSVQKLKSAPRALYQESRLKQEKNFSICPKLVINAERYGLILAPRLKKGYHQIWEANLQPLRPMLQHLLISSPQCSSIYQ